MLGPYRDPAPIDEESSPDPLPDACVPRGVGPEVCPACRPAPAAPLPALPPAYARAFSAAATLLLLVGSASLAATTWTVTSTIISARALPAVQAQSVAGPVSRPAPRVQDRQRPLPQVQTALAAPSPMDVERLHHRRQQVAPPVSPWPAPPLAAVGDETHEAGALWDRAQRLVSAGAELILVRATVARGAVASPDALADVVRHDRAGRLRVFPAAEPVPGGAASGPTPRAPAAPSPAALLGLRKGDLITAVNGYSMRNPEDSLRAYADVVKGHLHTAVVELVREGKPVALRIDWTG